MFYRGIVIGINQNKKKTTNDFFFEFEIIKEKVDMMLLKDDLINDLTNRFGLSQFLECVYIPMGTN